MPKIDFCALVTNEMLSNGHVMEVTQMVRRELAVFRLSRKTTPLLASFNEALSQPYFPGKQRLADIVKHDIEHGIAHETEVSSPLAWASAEPGHHQRASAISRLSDNWDEGRGRE